MTQFIINKKDRLKPQPIAARISRDMLKQLKDIAKQHDISLSELIGQMLQHSIDNYED